MLCFKVDVLINGFMVNIILSSLLEDDLKSTLVSIQDLTSDVQNLIWVVFSTDTAELVTLACTHKIFGHFIYNNADRTKGYV